MDLTKPFADYPHTKRLGPLVFLAGQGCRDPQTNSYPGTVVSDQGTLVSYDINAQTQGVFRNLERALESEGLDLTHLVDVTVFLTDMDDFQAMNEVWNARFSHCSSPTRTTVGVAKLPGHNQIEMKAIATSERND